MTSLLAQLFMEHLNSASTQYSVVRENGSDVTYNNILSLDSSININVYGIVYWIPCSF